MPRRPALTVAAIAGCLALALAGQAFGNAVMPATSAANTNRIVGRAADSYLTGLRTYAAAALWNRIDPVLHNYYEDVPIDQQLYILTTVATVQALDPRAVRSYSVGAWLLVRNDRVDEGIAMAERGVELNPDNGIALASLAQILWLYGDKDRALMIGERALGDGVLWPAPDETFTWYAVLRDIFETAGRYDLRDEMVARMTEIHDKYGVSGPPADADE